MKSISALFLMVLLVLVCSVAQAQVVTFTENGHFYEYVPFDGTFLTWDEARAAAVQRQYEGINGYLVTITSAEENAFVTNQFALDVEDFDGPAWIGGYEPQVDNVWLWADGPEADAQFADDATPTPPFNYANWDTETFVQPDNFGGTEEDRLIIGLGESGSFFTRGAWHDVVNDASLVTGYIVEYSIPESQPVPVNSLSWMLLLLAGTLAIGLYRVRTVT